MYSRYEKGAKHYHDGTDWRKLAMFTDAETVEVDGAVIQSNLPAAFAGYGTLHAWLAAIDAYFGAANGFASLGGDGKVPAGQLPSVVASGMEFKNGVSAAQDIESLMNAEIGATPGADDAGAYFIVTTSGELTNSSGDSAHHTIQAGAGDGGDDTFPVTLEAGDWLVLLKVESGTPLYTWGIIDNDYIQASISAFGLTRLSDAGVVTGLSGDDVITEGVLAALIAATDGIISDGKFTSNGFMKRTGPGVYAVDTAVYLTQANFNSNNNELAALQALADTVGFVRKTADGAYAIDENVYLTDYTVTEGDVTAHQAAIEITESQISDFGSYLESETSHADVVVDADFASEGFMRRGATAGVYSIDNTTYQRQVTVDSGAPSGGLDGDLWIVTS